MNEGEIRQIVKAAAEEMLTALGLDPDDKAEFRADLVHLRKWRKSVERVETIGWGTVITVIVSGFLGAAWLGFKTMLGK